MSMIRELRAAVRPARQRGRSSYDYSGTRGTALPGTAVVDCAVYRDGRRAPDRPTPEEALRRVRAAGDGSFVWIGLHEPTEQEFAGVARAYGLHPLAVEDAVQAHQRPKLERYDSPAAFGTGTPSLFTVFKTIHYVEHAELTASSQVVETGEVMCFIGQDYIITVRHGGQGSLRALRHRLESDPQRLAKGPSAVLHAIADQVTDSYLAVANAVQDDIDEVEIDVFSEGQGAARRSGDAGRIYQLKREVLQFKRAVAPLMRPMQLLSERPMRMIDAEIQNYFRDVADHLVRVHEQVMGFDELLNSILQANLAQATVAQNEDMRKITAWAAIFAVPTMIAGIYGMNFTHMPELEWEYGYPAVLLCIGAICAAMHRGFRRNGWL